MKKAASTTKRTTSKKPKTEGLGVIGELDRYLFGEGRHYQLYHKLGAHPYTGSSRGRRHEYMENNRNHDLLVTLVRQLPNRDIQPITFKISPFRVKL